MARIIQSSREFATDGEQRAAEELRKLPDNWVVITNKILPVGSRNSYEIDFIVIGDHLVFVIDEKSWRGRILGTDQSWSRADGSSERSPLNKVDHVAKALAGRLRDQVTGFANIPEHTVEGCVLLSRATEKPQLQDRRAAKSVFLLENVVEQLRERDRTEGNAQVGVLRSKIENDLNNVRHRPKFPKKIDLYTIEDITTGPAGSRIMRATHEEGDARILTVYNVASADPSLVEFYRQEFRALKDLRASGVVPECLDPFLWSEDFLVFPTYPPPGTSLSALPLPDSQDAVVREIGRAIQAFTALRTVHNAGIIHRALGPDIIHVDEHDGQCKIILTGFFAARRSNATISPVLNEQGLDDVYAAPEIRQTDDYGFADDGSDTYSLGLVFLERLAGVRIDKLINAQGFVEVPTGEGVWSYFPEDIAEEAIRVFRSILTRGILDPPDDPSSRRLTADECVELLTTLSQHLRAESGIEQQQLLDGRYTVVRELGTGASARTILATDTEADGLFALKQFLRPSSIRETGEARREFMILREYPHRQMPRVYDIYPLKNDVHVKMEYVEGPKLTAILSTYHGKVELCRALAMDLLSVVAHLEQHHLLHRDIKPDNIIIRDNSREAVLIDFGAATDIARRPGLSGTPGYLPPEAYFSEQPVPTMDRYAVAVVVFQALTGRLPFIDKGNSLEQRPLEQLDFLSDDERPFARALLRGVATNPDDRYESAEAFREALQKENEHSDEESSLSENINPWVDSLRGLYRNSSRGNADNRGLDSDFARETYVPTALDTRLLPAVFSLQPHIVFLSGSPGDGKTAFLEQVQDEIERRGGTRLSGDAAGWAWRLDGHEYRACHDASEAHAGKSADEQLLDRLEGLEGTQRP